MRCERTSQAEILNISPHGFWILVERRELFVPFAEFPSFKNAPVSQVMNVELQSTSRTRAVEWPRGGPRVARG